MDEDTLRAARRAIQERLLQAESKLAAACLKSTDPKVLGAKFLVDELRLIHDELKEMMKNGSGTDHAGDGD